MKTNRDQRIKRKLPPQDVTKPDRSQPLLRTASDNFTDQLLADLRTHQIELKMQNEELRRAHLDLEESRDRYLDLYEFAPVGYLTLSDKGIILDMNLTSSILFGRERRKMLNRHLARAISPEDSDRFHRMLGHVTNQAERTTFELKLRRADDSVFHAQLDCMRLARDGVPPVVRVAITDISERKRAAAEIENLAYYDSLTGLPNRRLLIDRLRQSLAAYSRTLQHGAILFVDLDDFKSLNDTEGHDVGDLLLQQVGSRLVSCVREGDTVARLGGDEFVVMLQGLSENSAEAVHQSRVVGEKILAVLRRPYLLADYRYCGSGSVGVALYGRSQDSVEELLKRADLSLYRAKDAGRSALRFFHPEMQTAVNGQSVLEAELRQALENGEFLLHYQPQMTREGKLIGAEALLRWQHPRRGLLLPLEFIPVAEEKGLIESLGLWVLETACLRLLDWSARAEMAQLALSVNVSAYQFSRPEFADQLLAIINRIGLDPRKLVVELTESVMLGEVDLTIATMSRLKGRGLRFSLDDFGMGYSSLKYLKDLPLDQLKIDQTFVHDLLVGSSSSAIVLAILGLGQSLGLTVIAEGVETVQQRDFLASHGCLVFQGLFFARALPMEDLLSIASSQGTYMESGQ